MIPRGIRFRVELPDKPARGYLCENFGAAFTLPERGPIGANGLANERDFLYPARRVRGARPTGHGRAKVRRQPLGRRLRPLAARRGRLARRTTCRTSTTGQLHGHRHDQLRPPRPVDLHRADQPDRHRRPRQRGLRDLPAALAGRRGHLPPAVVPPQHHVRVHGPGHGAPTTPRRRASNRAAAACTTRSPATARTPRPTRGASTQELTPQKLDETLAFMFESRWTIIPTLQAMEAGHRQRDYDDVWSGLSRNFR